MLQYEIQFMLYTLLKIHDVFIYIYIFNLKMSDLLKPIYVRVVAVIDIPHNDINFVVQIVKQSIYILFLFTFKSVKNNVLYLRRHTKRILCSYNSYTIQMFEKTKT